MGSGIRDNPPQRQLYRAFICKNVVPIDLYCIIESADIPLSLSFHRSFDHSGFCRFNFHFFDRHNATRHAESCPC